MQSMTRFGFAVRIAITLGLALGVSVVSRDAHARPCCDDCVASLDRCVDGCVARGGTEGDCLSSCSETTLIKNCFKWCSYSPASCDPDHVLALAGDDPVSQICHASPAAPTDVPVDPGQEACAVDTAPRCESRL